MPQHVRGQLGHRAPQMLGRRLAERGGEGVPADRPTTFGGEQHRPRQLPLVGELAADLLDPPDQQRPGIAEHRHQPLPGPRAARALAHPHVDLAQRAVLKMQALQPKPAQLPQPQPHFSGQPGHRVVASGGQPLTCARQLAAPGREERRQSGGRRRHPDLEVTAVARPVAVIDRGGDHPAGQLADLTPVSGFQEPEKQVDRLGLPPPGPHRLVPLRLAQEPVGVSGLDLPHRHTRLIQELLHRCDLAADRPIGHPVGQPGQHVLGQQVLLICGSFLRVSSDRGDRRSRTTPSTRSHLGFSNREENSG